MVSLVPKETSMQFMFKTKLLWALSAVFKGWGCYP